MALGKIDLSALNTQLFDEYKVTLYVPQIAGGVPKNKDLVAAWIDAANKEKSAERRQEIKDATIEEIPGLTDDAAAKGWNTFKSDENGLYLEGRCLKAALRESANILRTVVPTSESEYGITAFRSKMADQVFVKEEKVYFRPHGKTENIKTSVDDMEERPIHVDTALGPRSSIKRTDLVKDVVLQFTILRLAGGAVAERPLLVCLQFLTQLGIGADRSQGKGKVLEIEVEKIREVKPPTATVSRRGRKATEKKDAVEA